MKKRLGDYIQEYSVKNKSGEDIPVYSITNSQGFCRDYFSKEVASKDKTSYKIVPRGCFAYNPSRINVGSVDWQRDEERVIVSPLYNVFSVSPEIDQQYLYYYLKSSATLYRIKEVATGSVRDNLRLSMLYDFMIELPSLDVQRQIVSNLDLLASIIRQRNQQLTKLDELIKARFVEMFGDPYTNSKDYPLKKGESFFKLSNGKAVPESKRLNGGIPAYGGNGISWYTDESLFDADTIVVGRVGFQSGNVHLVKGPLWVTDNAMYMSSCDFSQYNLTFLIELMAHVDFTKFQDAGDLKKITQKPFMQFEYLCPPLSLQNQFSAFVAEVDKSKFGEVIYMKKSASRIVGLVMLIIAVAFIMFAANHPEMSFPWNNTITWLLYGLYVLVTVVLLIAPKMKK